MVFSVNRPALVMSCSVALDRPLIHMAVDVLVPPDHVILSLPEPLEQLLLICSTEEFCASSLALAHMLACPCNVDMTV